MTADLRPLSDSPPRFRPAIPVRGLLLALLFGLAACEAPAPATRAKAPDYMVQAVTEVGIAGGVADNCDGLVYEEGKADAAMTALEKRLAADGYSDAEIEGFVLAMRVRSGEALIAGYYAERGVDLAGWADGWAAKEGLTRICASAVQDAQRGVGVGQYLRLAA